MNFPKYLKEKLFPILINRVAVFFFIMCLLTLFLYAIGTRQGFVDSTQFGLIRLYVVLGIFLVAISVCASVINIVRFVTAGKKVRYLLRAGAYLLLTVFGAVSVLVVLFILTLSKGN